MVGGYDFAQSQFNRVIQAHRLPGSAIKPIIYAAALDKGYTPATVILDTPVIYKETTDSGEEVEWKPKNYEEEFTGATTVRKALTHSANIITIKILEDIGVDYAANYAHKLGIDLPPHPRPDPGPGFLGADAPGAGHRLLGLRQRRRPPYPHLHHPRSSIATAGSSNRPTRPIFPAAPAPDQQLIQQRAERVISPETAYLVTNLMESVVRNGTGWRAKALGRPVAGKTGTTNDLKDAWFAGFVPQLVAVSWVGYDQERPLGHQETGSRAAAPAWVAFMKEAVKGMPPQGISGSRRHRVPPRRSRHRPSGPRGHARRHHRGLRPRNRPDPLCPGRKKAQGPRLLPPRPRGPLIRKARRPADICPRAAALFTLPLAITSTASLPFAGTAPAPDSGCKGASAPCTAPGRDG